MVDVLGKDIMMMNGDVQFGKSQDFRLVSGEDNLAQSIITRCSTMKGEYVLTNLYGSNLHLSIGLPTDGFLKSAVKSYLFEVLNEEPRIASFEINTIEVVNRSTVNIEITVTPITSNVPFNIIFPIVLETGGLL